MTGVQRELESSRPIARMARNLYFWVIVGVALGVLVGATAPSVGIQLKPIGEGFVALIKMLIAPIIFCTIVLGIASVHDVTKVGRVGLKAFGYFAVVSSFALVIGLVVADVFQPGAGFVAKDVGQAAAAAKVETVAVNSHGAPQGMVDFFLGIIPTSLFSGFVEGKILQVVFVAVLIGFALQTLGEPGQAALKGVRVISAISFKLLGMVLMVAPIGAFGAIAGVVGSVGVSALGSLGYLMLAFYVTCLVFVVVVLGSIAALAKVNIFRLLLYLRQEMLLIVGTSSSESALPRLLAKLEHLGASRSVVGITVPTGYSFNLDGTAIYLTLTSLFIAQAQGYFMPIGDQIGLLAFMLIASKGAAGVTGAGLATLTASLEAYKPQLLAGVGYVVGIDRFMSEVRALTNFIGNSVATIVIARWEGEFDAERARLVLHGKLPFDQRDLAETLTRPTDQTPQDEPQERQPEPSTPKRRPVPDIARKPAIAGAMRRRLPSRPELPSTGKIGIQPLDARRKRDSSKRDDGPPQGPLPVIK